MSRRTQRQRTKRIRFERVHRISLRPDERIAVILPDGGYETEDLEHIAAGVVRWLGIDDDRIAVFANGTELTIVRTEAPQ